MNRRSSFVANAQSAKLMKPGDAALDHPARLTQATTMGRAAFGEFGADATRLQGISMRLRIVTAITLHAFGLVHRPAGFPRQMRDRLDQGQQLRDVVAVGLGQDDAQRNALRVDAEVVLAARLAAIGWVRSSFFPPCTARTEELSTTTRDRSILSAPRSFDNSTRCSRSHTPAFCHARSPRQQLMPEPQPISWGNISQGMPDCSTNKIPVSTRRLFSGLRPGYRLRLRLGAGRIGLITFHSSSSTSWRAMFPHKNKNMTMIVQNLLSFC